MQQTTEEGEVSKLGRAHVHEEDLHGKDEYQNKQHVLSNYDNA